MPLLLLLIRYLRHPSYFGWFYWSVGTQLALCNPVCTLAYAYAAWTFFRGRIPYEESLLVDFYGAEYVQYAQRTPIGIPGIPGFVAHSKSARSGGSEERKEK
jgi:protein-S-isoprenylcysteine O-methyltransferase